MRTERDEVPSVGPVRGPVRGRRLWPVLLVAVLPGVLPACGELGASREARIAERLGEAAALLAEGDWSHARDMYLKLAEEGVVEAYVPLGVIVEQAFRSRATWNPDLDPKVTPEYWFERAAEAGVAGGAEERARLALQTTNVDMGEVVRWKERAVELGSAQAALWLGRHHLGLSERALGNFSPDRRGSPGRAVHFFRLAADGGLGGDRLEGEYLLAATTLRLLDLATPEELEEAYRLLRAIPGDPEVAGGPRLHPDMEMDAEYQLGWAYLMGRGAPLDRDRAREHLETAGGQGHINAAQAVVAMVMEGQAEGAPEDAWIEAFPWMMRVIQGRVGDRHMPLEMAAFLGEWLARGIPGREQDPEAAWRILRWAAREGGVEAQRTYRRLMSQGSIRPGPDDVELWDGVFNAYIPPQPLLPRAQMYSLSVLHPEFRLVTELVGPLDTSIVDCHGRLPEGFPHGREGGRWTHEGRIPVTCSGDVPSSDPSYALWFEPGTGAGRWVIQSRIRNVTLDRSAWAPSGMW